MSKKHFEAFAALIKRHVGYAEANLATATAEFKADEFNGEEAESTMALCEAERRAIANLASDMCAEFAKSNPRFQRGRFLKACGLEDVA